jgi:hypothetical protein
VIWLVWRSVIIWRRPPAGGRALDWSLARAATIVVALFVVHSFFDYPLRTGAVMAMMAFACAILIEPPVGAKSGVGWELQAEPKRTRDRDARRLELASPPLRRPPHRSAAPSGHPPLVSRRWGDNIDWPEEWSKSSKPRATRDKGKPPNPSEPPDD